MTFRSFFGPPGICTKSRHRPTTYAEQREFHENHMTPSPDSLPPLVLCPANSHALTFENDGSAHMLWTDALPLGELGTLRVRRASWIRR